MEIKDSRIDAGKSEELVLNYSPGWTGAGETRHPIWIPDAAYDYFVMEDHEEYDLMVPFTRESWHGRMRACRDAEIGYLLLTEFWSKGIMTEAVRLICEIAFSELDLLRITGLVYAPNVASQTLLEKNGFVREGIQRNAVFKDGEVYDLCLYGKLK